MAGDAQHSRNRLYIELDPLAANVGVVRIAVAALAAQAGFSVSEVEEIKVAVSEAVSNAVLHGYGPRAVNGAGVIRVTATGWNFIAPSTGPLGTEAGGLSSLQLQPVT